MRKHFMTLSKLSTTAMAALILASASASATIVEFTTSHGNFKVNLHDETTPETVNNFLTYVNEGDYNNTIIHRTVDNFIVQGGGYDQNYSVKKVNGDIVNESGNGLKNDKGTIAMAKENKFYVQPSDQKSIFVQSLPLFHWHTK